MIALGKTNCRRFLLCTLIKQFIKVACHPHTPQRHFFFNIFFFLESFSPSLSYSTRFKDMNWNKSIINPARLRKNLASGDTCSNVHQKALLLIFFNVWEVRQVSLRGLFGLISFIELEGRSSKTPVQSCLERSVIKITFFLSIVAGITSCHEEFKCTSALGLIKDQFIWFDIQTSIKTQNPQSIPFWLIHHSSVNPHGRVIKPLKTKGRIFRVHQDFLPCLQVQRNLFVNPCRKQGET